VVGPFFYCSEAAEIRSLPSPSAFLRRRADQARETAGQQREGGGNAGNQRMAFQHERLFICFLPCRARTSSEERGNVYCV
jgi:hypothetical protein